MRSVLGVGVALLMASAVMAQHFAMIPDFEGAYPPERIVAIPAGESRAMPSGDIDLLWIEGTCVAPRQGDLDLRVREIVVAPGGRLDIGTQSDPVLGKVTITFADGDFLPDDTAQWGHGLLVFGDFTCWGSQKTPFLELSESLSSVSVPGGVGWNAGDLIRLPDTRSCGPNYNQGYRNDRDYRLISQEQLDASPTFRRDHNGVVGPIVANLTRNVTFKSENPSGTRGHSIVTDAANASIGYTAFVGMGRTRPAPLGGDNLIGRYPVHFHHSIGASRSVHGVVVDGLDYTTKWGVSVHHSSWVTIEECIVTRVGGAGFVTEDGSEVGNRFAKNLSFDNNAGVRNFPTGQAEGFDGVGFWFKSMVQFIDDNIAINNRHGFQSAILGLDEGGGLTAETAPKKQYQSTPGGAIDSYITVYQSTLSGERNRFVCNNETGYDAWGSKCNANDQPAPVYYSPHVLPVHWKQSAFAHNGKAQASNTFAECSTVFQNCDFIGGYDKGVGINSVIDYHRMFYVDGCDFSGLTTGLVTGRGGLVQGCVFNTTYGIQYNAEASQGFLFGFSEQGNVFTGVPYSFVKTVLTREQIPEHAVLMSDVYAAIAEFRSSIGGGTDPDPNDAERQRLMEEIASVEAQIGNLQALLVDLKLQLESLGN